MKMKTVTVTKRTELLHIEAPGCIVNVHVGLTDMKCRAVTAVSIICDQFAGERYWTLPDHGNVRSISLRVVRSDHHHVLPEESDDKSWDGPTEMCPACAKN